MHVKILGRRPYAGIEQAMRDFTHARGPTSADELWLVEHEPVFTLGLAARPEHLLAPGEIPVVQTQRGGQVTYHGPGQVTAYVLVDLGRLGIYVKEYVHRLEEAVLRTLASYGITGHRVRGAPGIYVRLDDPRGHARLPPPGADLFSGLAKVAALGIKVARGCAYHGLALNVAMDLEPFTRINPCGYAGLTTVDLRTLAVATDCNEAAARLAAELQGLLQPR